MLIDHELEALIHIAKLASIYDQIVATGIVQSDDMIEARLAAERSLRSRPSRFLGLHGHCAECGREVPIVDYVEDTPASLVLICGQGHSLELIPFLAQQRLEPTNAV
jgi:hypothetical protein